MPQPKRVTDEQLAASYARTGSVHKTGAELGIHGGSVHERLVKLGIQKKMNVFTPEDDRLLVQLYNTYARIGELDILAKHFGRTKHFLCRQAKRLGLTDPNRPKPYLPQLSSEAQKERIRVNGHSRGMLGKKHSRESLSKMMGRPQSEEQKNATSQRMFERWHSMTPEERIAFSGDAKRSWKAAWREIGGVRKYYRSRWEANYARYLEWLKKRGEIRSWKHEPKTFWFLAIKRGTRSYLPDFEVVENNGTASYHEVKGWMDDASRVKLKRMAKYYPEEKIVLIDRAAYMAIAKTMKRIIVDWE